MNFIKEYFVTPDYKGAPVKTAPLLNKGTWRSRWEREKELNRSKNTVKDQILYIDTKPSPHDYIVTQVHAVSPKGEFVRITPVKQRKLKARRSLLKDYCKTHGKTCNRCVNRKNHNKIISQKKYKFKMFNKKRFN